MTAGRRDQLVTLQRYTTTQDDYGEEAQTWASIGTEWAAVFWGRGDERRQAAMERGTQVATFRVLSTGLTRSVGFADRLTLDGRAWDIVSIAPAGRAEIEFTATLAAK